MHLTDTSQLDAAFGALADPTRRAILARLTSGDATVMELAAPFAMSQPAISKHLKVLERANLITRSRAGACRPCRLDARGIEAAAAWLDSYRRFWSDSFDALDGVIAVMKAEQDKRRRQRRRRNRRRRK